MSARRWLLVVVSCVVVGAASACILGPKQDDPSAGSANTTDTDAGLGDSGAFRADSSTAADAAPPPNDTTPAPGDVGGSDTGAKSDTAPASDAVGDIAEPPDAPSDAGETSIGDAGEVGLDDAPTD